MSRLTPTETAALVVLMAEARMVGNAELRALANVELTGPSRAKLVDQLGLVTQGRVGRGYAFALSPKGRETVLRLLADLPKPQGASAGALQHLLGALYRVGVSAGDFGGEPASMSTAPVTLGDPESQVRAAYAGLATHPGAWVALADLRAALPSLSRSDVDTALRSMARSTGVQLIPVANLKSLRPRDREAALHLGGEDNHVLAIEAA